MIVYKVIKKIQPCSDKMIAEYLNWKINRVTGRRNSLVNYHLVQFLKKDIDKVPPYEKVIFWSIPKWMSDNVKTTL